MKYFTKYVLLFLVFVGVTIVYLSFPLKSDAKFVSIKNSKFYLDGKDFYPLTLNYMVSVQTDEKEIWPCAYTGYNKGFKNLYTTKDSCLMQLKSDMDLIRQMGFNTVRVVVIGEETINKATGGLSITARIKNDRNVVMPLSNDNDYKKYFAAIKQLLDVINNAGLKTIFLTRMSPDVKTTEDHLRRLAINFKDESAILAYDLFNEPLYFDTLERNKQDVYEAVKRWNKTLKMYAPNQLSTIGLEGIREVFEWDPNILDVDFISVHPYEYEPEQVRNEMYWYGKYIKKPWMVGETAIPADNDSVSYMDQKKFAAKTLQQAFNCGAVGYSWWQYKDVEWFTFHANFMGVVNLKGETKVNPNDLVIQGTVKPVSQEFRNFNPEKTKDSCICLSNYYNYSQHKSFRITGILKDANDQPIEGGVVLAWNEWWSHSYHTISKADGSFELLGDFSFYHWMASSTLHTMTRGDISPDNAVSKDGIPTINLGTIKIEKLSFL